MKMQTIMQLEDLLVIDQLSVGPPLITTNKLVIPYTLNKGEEEFTNDLIFKYEEPVFAPQSPQSQNLASLIGAQLALNYGLFCKEIVFHGLFDGQDRRFLREMMENTSREILVNKLHKPNAFLQSEVPVQKRPKYTQAKLRFTDSFTPSNDLAWTQWEVDRRKHCVLSSGGKDSLLSYGLLKELGKEVHPIFGNESGRHWFTALNAYRHLQSTDEHAARVWMNADRMFAWMLRQLPFVRPDFAQVRADDYPIRLWTVAIFLFSVLPLLKKRGIGRLIIGDEYDSTQRERLQGITHYNGLYDQSRFFDQALSRFFMKKGWGISQFSLLRPLSELLILQILVDRYPELQAQQISCHAAHEQDGRIRPCGKCEKCRRIVGMLTALDADPRRCGYTSEQIQKGLTSLESQGVKQLGSDASHLQYLLQQQGILSTQAKAHPEILQLRFDSLRSQVSDIPGALREPLYKLFLLYAKGSVQLEQNKWRSFDLLRSPMIDSVYPFEDLKPRGAATNSTHRWAQMTWEELQERLQESKIALLPVGAIEQHGPHLPVDVDAFDALYLANKVALACQDPKPLVLPLVPYGVSYHHNDFPGTLSISNEAMAQFIYDIGRSLASNGIEKLVIINGHGDNAPTLSYAAQMINRDTGIFVCVETGETSDLDIEKITQTANDIHAGEIETSTTLAIRPSLVKMHRAVDETPHFENRYLNFSSPRHVPWYVRTKKISQSGVLGNATLASSELGEKIWSIMIAHLVALVESLKELQLDEIPPERL